MPFLLDSASVGRSKLRRWADEEDDLLFDVDSSDGDDPVPPSFPSLSAQEATTMKRNPFDSHLG
jgi:hypothetical protein